MTDDHPSGSNANPDVEALRALVRYPTVSHRDEDRLDHEAFTGFLAELARRFPLLHDRLEHTRIDTYGLLFHWRGRRDDRPVVLMAHLDVVPVDESAPWQHPPFSAAVVDGAVWGRGTLDDKGALVAICVAVERLLRADVVPAQDVWLSFGCNEEVSGAGADLAVAALRERSVRPWFVLDEGGAVAEDAFAFVDAPLAVIGVSEKGTTSIRLSVTGRGGHASTPARLGPTARLARAIVRIDRSPFPPNLPDATIEMFRRLAAHTTGPLARVFASADRLRPALARALIAMGPESAAVARTTVAVTTMEGSPALNVIASSASAGLNVRIAIGESVESVVARLRAVVKDKEVQIEVIEAGEPSPVSPIDDEAFELLESVIGEVFPDAVPTPYVMMAATDARRFTAICDRVYRFTPFRMTKEQRLAIHSFDEHVRVDDFVAGIDWYQRLLERIPE